MKRASVVLLALVCQPSLAVAQSAPAAPIKLTVAEAVARTLATSPRLAEIEARAQASEASAAGRAAAERPQLAVVAGYTRTNHVDEFGIPVPGGGLRIIYPDVPDNYRSRLDLQWPIYTAGRLDAFERAARAETQALEKDLTAGRSDLRLEATRAYWALVTAGESVRVVREALVRMDAHLADVRNHFNAGLVPSNEVAAVEAQRSRQQLLLIEAENTREVASADLHRLTGIPAATPIEPVDPLAPLPEHDDAIEALIGRAREARPERQALQLRAQAVGERRVAAEAALKPAIAMNAGVDYARPNARIFPREASWRESWDVGVNVTWLLWDGGRARADIAEATATQRAANQRVAEFDTVLDFEVRQRTFEMRSARAALPAAADGVRAASEARRVVSDRFGAGVATNTDVLDAQVALLQAELDRTRALANLRLAEAHLDRAVGR